MIILYITIKYIMSIVVLQIQTKQKQMYDILIFTGIWTTNSNTDCNNKFNEVAYYV